MGAEYSTDQSAEPPPSQQTAVVRRRSSTVDQVHQLLSAAIAQGTLRLDNVGQAVGHVNARISPLIGAQLDIDARQGRMEEHLSKLDERLDALFEQLGSLEQKINKLVDHSEETEKRRQRISAAMSGEKTTLRRRSHNTPMPAEERFRLMAQESNGGQNTPAPSQ